jgi:hypothetical protein
MYAAVRPGNLGFGNLVELSNVARRRTSVFLFLNSWRLDGVWVVDGDRLSRLVMTSVWIMGSYEYFFYVHGMVQIEILIEYHDNHLETCFVNPQSVSLNFALSDSFTLITISPLTKLPVLLSMDELLRIDQYINYGTCSYSGLVVGNCFRTLANQIGVNAIEW